jgi:hypothetical protein
MSGVDVLASHPKLTSFIATRDRRIAKKQPWSPTPLRDLFTEMLKNGCVKVGGRATCGISVDPTWTIFTSWGEVVRKARAEGFAIAEASIKHGNAWATKAGGFWNESEYTLASVTQPEYAEVLPTIAPPLSPEQMAEGDYTAEVR